MIFMGQLNGNIIHKQHVINKTVALYEAGLIVVMKKAYVFKA